MHLRESILVALDTLRAHKLRSVLTLLGIIVSVWTLVAVVSLVQGVNQYVGDKIAGLGSNTFTLTQYSLEQLTDRKRFVLAQKRNKPVSAEEFAYLRDHARLAREVGASVDRNSGVLRAGNRSTEDVTVKGQTENEIRMSTYDVAQGRFLTASDETHRTQVAFLGPDVVEELFAGVNPIGRLVNIDGADFQVIGVATAQGNVFGQSQDNFAIIPLGTYRRLYGVADSLSVDVQATSALSLDATSDEVRMLLRGYRHLGYNDDDNFGIIGADSVMALWHSLTGAIAAVMIGVSVVFLVVGGIVIMNIMLAAVTERTREVGIRKALGARRRDILLQFLIEAATLSSTGGILGVMLAFAFTKLAGRLTPLPFSLPWLAVAAALLVSTMVGLFFGIYPARKAARLDPITALRAEV